MNSMFLTLTDAIEVSQIIRSPQPKISCESDNLSQCFKKQFGEQLYLPITILINL